MADVFLFMRHGWKNIWRQKTIWLFSMIPFLTQLINVLLVRNPTDRITSFLFLVINSIFIILFFISYIGVPYLAYSFLIGKPATTDEALNVIKKVFGRVIGCSCLSLLVFSPILFLALAVSINSSTHAIQLSSRTFLVFLPFSIFSAVPQFTMVTFFENDWGVRQSLDKAWYLFKSHFGVLAVLGLVLIIILRVCFAMSALITMLIQSGIDISYFRQLNFLFPSATLSNKPLFILINGVGQTIFTPLVASVFISAYLKYSDVKPPYLMRIE